MGSNPIFGTTMGSFAASDDGVTDWLAAARRQA